MTGQYSVVNCGENTTLVVNSLRTLYSALLPVIQDAKSANPSAAYTTFFKNSSYAPFVSTLFTNVTKGVPMTPPASYSLNGAVAFLCVTAPEQFTFTLDGPRDAYNECLADPYSNAKYIAFDPPKPYVILCPSFFTSGKALAPPPNTCLPYSSYLNRFQSNGQEVRQYQIWFFLEMLTHYYIYTSTRHVDLSNNNNANACFRLDAERSRLNVNNYVYYAASKSLLPSFYLRRPFMEPEDFCMSRNDLLTFSSSH